jgi:hypothetical protein
VRPCHCHLDERDSSAACCAPRQLHCFLASRHSIQSLRSYKFNSTVHIASQWHGARGRGLQWRPKRMSPLEMLL